MKHVWIRQNIKRGMILLSALLGLLDSKEVNEKRVVVSQIQQKECAFCGAGDQAVLNQAEAIQNRLGDKLEREPGMGLVNLETGEWIDLQLWDTVSGKRGREEIHFGDEDTATVEFETMKDRGCSEVSIQLSEKKPKESNIDKLFCEQCLEAGINSMCSFAFSDCVNGRLIPIEEGHTFFMVGDYAVFMDFDRLPSEIHFLVFYAPENAAFLTADNQ